MGSSSSLSGLLKALADNPLVFLSKNAIVCAARDVPPEYRSDDGSTFRSGTAGVKLVKTPTATVYGLQFVALKAMATDKEAAQAFVLGFKPKNANNDVPFVDIPRKNAPHLEDKFVFTVGLTGCSVIVTRLDGNTFRVFHDSRMDSAVLHDNVEMCVNYNDYRIGGRYLSHTGNAITCTQFKGGAWKMFLQRQLPPPNKEVVPGGSPKWEVEAYAVVAKGTLSAEVLEKEFNDRRAIIQQRVKDNARILKVDNSLIEGAKDGVVAGVEFKKDAIRGWEALRNASKRHIQTDRERLMDPSLKETYKRLKDTYARYDDEVMHSEQIDETWIWLQLKKKKH